MRREHSRNSRKLSDSVTKAIRAKNEFVDELLDREMGKSHRFTIFRAGWDVCAKCRRPRSEHE